MKEADSFHRLFPLKLIFFDVGDATRISVSVVFGFAVQDAFNYAVQQSMKGGVRICQGWDTKRRFTPETN